MVKLITEAMVGKWAKEGYFPCKDMHDGTCERWLLIKFVQVFRASIKVYTPIHLIPFMIYKLKALRKE
jgi:hypothetical protein